MMTSLNTHKRGICVAAALALLAAVMTSPIRPLASLGALSCPDALQCNLAIPLTQPAHLSLKSVTPRGATINAVRSENEEEELGRAESPAGCFVCCPLSASLKTPARARAVFGLTQASQPLRC
jgi:hypothetical protein